MVTGSNPTLSQNLFIACTCKYVAVYYHCYYINVGKELLQSLNYKFCLVKFIKYDLRESYHHHDCNCWQMNSIWYILFNVYNMPSRHWSTSLYGVTTPNTTMRTSNLISSRKHHSHNHVGQCPFLRYIWCKRHFRSWLSSGDWLPLYWQICY
jgi:hypothetical protein